jgi:competence protein ComEA
MKLNFTHALLGILIVLAIAGAVAMTVWSNVSASDIRVVEIAPTAVPDPANANNQADTQVGVYLSGAVVNPGVYTTDGGSRLANVLLLAGGATAEADLTAVNLAAIVHDEDHWHIPERNEVLSSFTGLPKPGVNAEFAAAVQDVQRENVKVDLNSADVELLKKLPGIGEVRAQAIVSHRDANGDFVSVDGLLGVKGIGIGTVENIRELVTVE